jgi:hypothetical protein
MGSSGVGAGAGAWLFCFFGALLFRFVVGIRRSSPSGLKNARAELTQAFCLTKGLLYVTPLGGKSRKKTEQEIALMSRAGILPSLTDKFKYSVRFSQICLSPKKWDKNRLWCELEQAFFIGVTHDRDQ